MLEAWKREVEKKAPEMSVDQAYDALGLETGVGGWVKITCSYSVCWEGGREKMDREYWLSYVYTSPGMKSQRFEKRTLNWLRNTILTRTPMEGWVIMHVCLKHQHNVCCTYDTYRKYLRMWTKHMSSFAHGQPRRQKALTQITLSCCLRPSLSSSRDMAKVVTSHRV